MPIAELPEEVCFTLREVALLLFVADIAVECSPGGRSEQEAGRRAQRMITSRLWPELGDLLGDDDENGE